MSVASLPTLTHISVVTIEKVRHYSYKSFRVIVTILRRYRGSALKQLVVVTLGNTFNAEL